MLDLTADLQLYVKIFGTDKQTHAQTDGQTQQ
jgi:hypothetical protein